MGCPMEHIRETIATFVAELRTKEAEVVATKKLINTLCLKVGDQPMFTGVDEPADGAGVTFRNDEFYGQPLSSVVRLVLEARKRANQGAASVAELYDAMEAGGYNFGSEDVENAKRGLRISLTKNSQTFHKLPNGRYGLRDWYPEIRDPKPSKGGSDKVEVPVDPFDFEAKEKATSEPVNSTADSTPKKGPVEVGAKK